jgi:hypothetical protein
MSSSGVAGTACCGRYFNPVLETRSGDVKEHQSTRIRKRNRVGRGDAYKIIRFFDYEEGPNASTGPDRFAGKLFGAGSTFGHFDGRK